MTPTDKPILFSGPMVRALLDGRKTQTRRVVKSKDIIDLCDGLKGATGLAAQYTTNLPIRVNVGDRLWVRETWRPREGYGAWDLLVDYAADGATHHLDSDLDVGDWRFPKAAKTGTVSPLFMPRWASRLTLTVTDVRVQRLQDISEGDAIAEGCRPFFDEDNPRPMRCPNGGTMDMAPLKGPLDDFQRLWNSINGPDAWDANPWVAAYTFTVHRCNIDELEADHG